MQISIKHRRAFYMVLVEHFFRLAARRKNYEVIGAFNQEWHKATTEWLKSECSTEERAIILDFYTYNQSIGNCSNKAVIEKIEPIAEKFAIEKGFC